jgi:hypothetical protein
MGDWLAVVRGHIGGQSKSRRKQRAARKNGAKSDGRPRIRTLAERILRRKMDATDHHYAFVAYQHLEEDERKAFRKWAGIMFPEDLPIRPRRKRKQSRGQPEWLGRFDWLKTRDYHWQKPDEEIRFILRKFRLMANRHRKEHR